MFYHFNQNNSGGYFVENKDNGVGSDVIIEATDSTKANALFFALGDKVSGFEEFCDCCGERWYPVDDSDGKDVPTIYGEPVNECKSRPYRAGCFIHHLNGTIEEVVFPT